MTAGPGSTRPDPLNWIKARASHDAAACVELAVTGSELALRDSKAPESGSFHFTYREVEVFFDAVKGGEFDHLLTEMRSHPAR